jgi:hypothetical protein
MSSIEIDSGRQAAYGEGDDPMSKKLRQALALTDLNWKQQAVLWATKGYKASYPPTGKHNRFYEAWMVTNITKSEWDKAVADLRRLKLLSGDRLTTEAKKLFPSGVLAQHALPKLTKLSGRSKPSSMEWVKMEMKLKGASRAQRVTITARLRQALNDNPPLERRRKQVLWDLEQMVTSFKELDEAITEQDGNAIRLGLLTADLNLKHVRSDFVELSKLLKEQYPEEPPPAEEEAS